MCYECHEADRDRACCEFADEKREDGIARYKACTEGKSAYVKGINSKIPAVISLDLIKKLLISPIGIDPVPLKQITSDDFPDLSVNRCW